MLAFTFLQAGALVTQDAGLIGHREIRSEVRCAIKNFERFIMLFIYLFVLPLGAGVAAKPDRKNRDPCNRVQVPPDDSLFFRVRGNSRKAIFGQPQ